MYHSFLTHSSADGHLGCLGPRLLIHQTSPIKNYEQYCSFQLRSNWALNSNNNKEGEVFLARNCWKAEHTGNRVRKKKDQKTKVTSGTEEKE